MVGIGFASKSIDNVVKKICKKEVLYNTLLRCEMLAIDEISMLDCTTLDYINQILKTIRKNDKPFGGIQVIIVGDFFQLPPVQIKKHERNFCFKSQAWKELNLQTIILKEVKRQTEKEFSNALNNVRMGKTSARNLKIFYYS